MADSEHKRTGVLQSKHASEYLEHGPRTGRHFRREFLAYLPDGDAGFCLAPLGELLHQPKHTMRASISGRYHDLVHLKLRVQAFKSLINRVNRR